MGHVIHSKLFTIHLPDLLPEKVQMTQDVCKKKALHYEINE